MKVLGIDITKGSIRYCLLDGKKTAPRILAKGKHDFRINENDIPALMKEFDNAFREIIEEQNPEKISYKLHLQVDKLQIFYMHLPIGILNLIAHEKNIEVENYNILNFQSSKKLGCTEKMKAAIFLDKIFVKEGPCRDSYKNCILPAWFALE